MAKSLTSHHASKLLQKCTLFAALDEKGRHELAARAHVRSFAAGESICELGDRGDSMIAVAVGTVRVSLPTPKGKQLILADLPPGELLGEIALLDGMPRSANATALTNCELVILERRDVVTFLERNPAACLKLMEMLCKRIRRSDERMYDIAFFDLPVRLAKTLLHYARHPTHGDAGAMKLSLSQKELAEMTGGARENVNRCLRGWQRQGILDLKDRWTIILKPGVLSDLAKSA